MSRRRQLSKVRRQMRKEFRHCTYCGAKLQYKHRTLDHVKARSKGGADDKSNLVIACTDCNRMKAARDVTEFLGGAS